MAPGLNLRAVGQRWLWQGLDGTNRQSPIASVQWIDHSAVPCETNVARMNANHVIRFAAERKQGLWGLIIIFVFQTVWYDRQRSSSGVREGNPGSFFRSGNWRDPKGCLNWRCPELAFFLPDSSGAIALRGYVFLPLVRRMFSSERLSRLLHWVCGPFSWLNLREIICSMVSRRNSKSRSKA